MNLRSRWSQRYFTLLTHVNQTTPIYLQDRDIQNRTAAFLDTFTVTGSSRLGLDRSHDSLCLSVVVRFKHYTGRVAKLGQTTPCWIPI